MTSGLRAHIGVFDSGTGGMPCPLDDTAMLITDLDALFQAARVGKVFEEPKPAYTRPFPKPAGITTSRLLAIEDH